MAKQDDFIRTALRVPPGLHAKIHKAAEHAGRTFNAEIVHRLEGSFALQQSDVEGKLMAIVEGLETLKVDIGKLKK